jgi:hypothetical protein
LVLMAAAPSRGRLAWLHVGLAIALVICSTAFVVELWRAIDGNSLSWAYVVEWPLLLGYAWYMWRRLVREERGLDTRAPAEQTAAEAASLEAWNQHLAALHAEDAAARAQRPSTS